MVRRLRAPGGGWGAEGVPGAEGCARGAERRRDEREPWEPAPDSPGRAEPFPWAPRPCLQTRAMFFL